MVEAMFLKPADELGKNESFFVSVRFLISSWCEMSK
jgi:hypothetical protein